MIFPRHPTPDARRPRRGLTILEVSISLIVLSFAVGGLLQILSLAAAQRRTSEVRRLALLEVANQAEQIALVPWEELTAEKLAARQPSEALRETVPSAKLAVTISDEPGPPSAKRVLLSIQWTTPAGDVGVKPVELAIWRHQPEAQP